jgi:galactose mutarotase-like enzyme
MGCHVHEAFFSYNNHVLLSSIYNSVCPKSGNIVGFNPRAKFSGNNLSRLADIKLQWNYCNVMTACARGQNTRDLATVVCRVSHAASGRVMHVYTDQPGLQFYTGNFLNVSRARQGRHYGRHAGFAMETQNYPDAVNKVGYRSEVGLCECQGI